MTSMFPVSFTCITFAVTSGVNTDLMAVRPGSTFRELHIYKNDSCTKRTDKAATKWSYCKKMFALCAHGCGLVCGFVLERERESWG